MSLEALIIFSLLNAGQLAENTQGEVHKNPQDAYVYVQKEEDNK
ncbi:transporter [Bacillus sp. C1]